MNYATKRWPAAVILVAGISAGVIVTALYGKAAKAADSPVQDVLTLDRRLSMLEQRLVNMEAGINRLEQQSSLANRRSLSMNSDTYIERFGADIGRLRNSIDEVECSITKLDQRTLSESVREKLTRAGSTDPCRLNFNTPVQFSARP